ncbi:MAG: hypothetical protein Q9185_004049 [Variospora sp. 1 TL-2023]
MHYQQLPSLLRLLFLLTFILPSFAVQNNDEDFERNFDYRYIDLPTASPGWITLSIPPTEINVPFNNLYETHSVQTSTIAVKSIKDAVRGDNDFGVPVNLTATEIWCECFADLAGKKLLAVPFTVGAGIVISGGSTTIASIFCSDQRGLKKYIYEAAAETVLGVKEGLDKLRRGKQTKKARRFSL